MRPPQPRLLRILAASVAAIILGSSSLSLRAGAAGHGHEKLDSLLQGKPAHSGRSQVVLRLSDPGAVAPVIALAEAAGGHLIRRLPLADSVVLDLPNAALSSVADSAQVARVSLDRVVVGSMERTAATIGATAVRQQLGYDGAGIGVAVIDSGVAASLDDLSDPATGTTRVSRFVDFVNGRQTSYDDYGHGTHVAGIIAGNGFDSGGARSGIAPKAQLIVLKVLDGAGRGRISDVIAALDYVVANKAALNIRIINLSVSTGVFELYESDPLTLAAKRAVTAGIVVVASAGNNGRNATGAPQYGGITAPGNAPWVLTVGASSHMGTVDRKDDTMAAFSSRGPTAIDFAAKPDVVAPGVGIESLSDPGGLLYATRSPYLLSGTVPTAYDPYLSLSGTSMAASVVAGTVALMIEANPALTPNAVKAILQYTAQEYKGYDALTQGAGFINAKGAVDLAVRLATPAAPAPPGPPAPPPPPAPPAQPEWSRHIIWGNALVEGGDLTTGATAWSLDVTWGATRTSTGAAISWGVDKKKIWQVNGPSKNVVTQASCEGKCPDGPNGPLSGASAGESDTVVWGTSDTEGDTVVWGTAGCSDPSCEPIVWKQQ